MHFTAHTSISADSKTLWRVLRKQLPGKRIASLSEEDCKYPFWWPKKSVSNGKILSCPDTKLVEHVSWRSEFLCRVWISEHTCSNGITGTILLPLSMQGKLLHFLSFRMGSLSCCSLLYLKVLCTPLFLWQEGTNFFSSRARARIFYGQSEFLQQWSLGRMEKDWRWGRYIVLAVVLKSCHVKPKWTWSIDC